MDGAAQPHELIFIDEAGFDLSKTRRRGRNVIGQRAIVHVPGQRGGNITLCAAISLRGLLHHHAKLGPYNSQHILTFLDALHNIVVQNRPDQPRFVVIWDNVSFHRAALVQAWFTNHNQFEVVYLPPYSPFLNPIEEFFSAWRWRVYDRRPHASSAGNGTGLRRHSGDRIHGWFRHARGYFPRCLAGEDIACDVDEVLWPDPNRRRDPWAHVCTIVMIFLCLRYSVFFLLLHYVFFFFFFFFALSEFMVLQCTVLQCTILSRPICFFGCLKMCLLKICLLNKQWKSKTAVFYIK